MCECGIEILDVAAGGADHSVQLLDTRQDVIAASLTGHTKKARICSC